MVKDLQGNPPSLDEIHTIYQNLQKEGATPLYDPTTHALVGVHTSHGSVTPDNGMTTIEFSLDPSTNLQDMHSRWMAQLQEVKKSAPKDIVFLSLSRQPVMPDDSETYQKFVAQKGIYPVLRSRGWDHRNGLTTAAVQACIDVSVDEAMRAIEVLQGLTPWIVALFGNSPLAYGKQAGIMESRLASWDRLMATSHIAADQNVINVMKEAPESWCDYLYAVWNHPPVFLPAEGTGQEYKKALCIVPVDPHMTMLDFLEHGGMFRTYTGETYDEPKHVSPSSFYVDQGFWWVFWGARLRMTLPGSDPQAIAKAVRTRDEETVKALIKKHAKGLYVEVRDPGTTAHPLSTIAFVLGILENLEAALQFVRTYPWNTLAERRTAASVHGRKAVDNMDLVLNIARQGLLNRQHNEESFLDPLITQKDTPAQAVIEDFEAGGIEQVITKHHF